MGGPSKKHKGGRCKLEHIKRPAYPCHYCKHTYTDQNVLLEHQSNCPSRPDRVPIDLSEALPLTVVSDTSVNPGAGEECEIQTQPDSPENFRFSAFEEALKNRAADALKNSDECTIPSAGDTSEQENCKCSCGHSYGKKKPSSRQRKSHLKTCPVRGSTNSTEVDAHNGPYASEPTEVSVSVSSELTDKDAQCSDGIVKDGVVEPIPESSYVSLSQQTIAVVVVEAGEGKSQESRTFETTAEEAKDSDMSKTTPEHSTVKGEEEVADEVKYERSEPDHEHTLEAVVYVETVTPRDSSDNIIDGVKNASGAVPKPLVEEGNDKLMNSHESGVALSVDSSSRNSLFSAAKLYVLYPWQKKMQELPIPNSNRFLSILFLPKASDNATYRYNDLEDTLSRADAWCTASQASGVPIIVMNTQTESLLTKITGETVSSTVNAHGIDIEAIRAVRLWYAPLEGEIAVEIKIHEGDLKLGFAIDRTEEGFISVTSVIDDDEDSPATRSNLNILYREASKARKQLIISRISNEKVLPWMVSSGGAIGCYDATSLSENLSLHLRTKEPISLHVFVWDQEVAMLGNANLRTQTSQPVAMHLPQSAQTATASK